MPRTITTIWDETYEFMHIRNWLGSAYGLLQKAISSQ